jgi:hypothetical protein
MINWYSEIPLTEALIDDQDPLVQGISYEYGCHPGQKIVLVDILRVYTVLQ